MAHSSGSRWTKLFLMIRSCSAFLWSDARNSRKLEAPPPPKKDQNHHHFRRLVPADAVARRLNSAAT